MNLVTTGITRLSFITHTIFLPRSPKRQILNVQAEGGVDPLPEGWGGGGSQGSACLWGPQGRVVSAEGQEAARTLHSSAIIHSPSIK